jgi:hypothetical protein
MPNKMEQEVSSRTTNSKPIPHIPLPFKEVMSDVLKVKPPKKQIKKKTSRTSSCTQS